MLPSSGGDYEYILQSFGSLMGFLVVWAMVILVIPVSNAIAALTFSNYILQVAFPCKSVPSLTLLLSVIVILLLTCVNIMSVKFTTRLQTAFSAGKTIAMLFIIILGVYAAAKGNVGNYSNLFENTKLEAASIVQSFYNGLFCYAGWNYLNFIAEEIREPRKNLPRSIWIGMSTVIIIFMLINMAYFTLLSPSQMAHSNAVAVTFAEQIWQPLGIVISLCVGLSTFGFLNGVMLTTSRIVFGAARNGHMPQMLALVHVNYLTPIISLTVLGALSIVFLFAVDIFFLVNITAFTEYLTISFSVIGLLVLRYKHPEWERPVKVNLIFPIVFLFVCLFILITSMVTLPKETLIACITFGSGILVYFFTIVLDQPKPVQEFMHRITAFTQKISNSLFDEKNLR